MSDALVFVATVEKVQTMTDGAIRVYLDLSEHDIGTMAALAACRVKGLVLKFEATELAEDAPEPSRYSHYKKDG